MSFGWQETMNWWRFRSACHLLYDAEKIATKCVPSTREERCPIEKPRSGEQNKTTTTTEKKKSIRKRRARQSHQQYLAVFSISFNCMNVGWYHNYHITTVFISFLFSLCSEFIFHVAVFSSSSIFFFRFMYSMGINISICLRINNDRMRANKSVAWACTMLWLVGISFFTLHFDSFFCPILSSSMSPEKKTIPLTNFIQTFHDKCIAWSSAHCERASNASLIEITHTHTKLWAVFCKMKVFFFLPFGKIGIEKWKY